MPNGILSMVLISGLLQERKRNVPGLKVSTVYKKLFEAIIMFANINNSLKERSIFDLL